jgi:cysteinyl-tRNA synthetase
MPVRIHDTMTRDKVALEPREPGKVSIYVCGPTVYDVPHIGHGRTAIVFDTIRRYLEWTGLDVTYVTNVTDVEDKIIRRAAETGTTEPDVAARFEAAYFDEMARLGVRKPDRLPHATEYIGPMQALIGELVSSGSAYTVDGENGGVYFDVTTFPSYGALPHRTLEQLLDSAGARVEVDEAKRNPVDFALWKAAKPGEPAWDSPWGRGRPGWHIECSAMSLDLLGEGFDLHGGGDDLVFPHHENERAQAEGAGHRFARHWIHSAMVQVGGEKMSKSLGNFTTLAEALDAYGPRAFRMAVLQTHYRRAMELGDRELSAAAAAVDRLDALFRRAAVAGIDPTGAPLDDASVERFRAAMDDDFGTPAAVAAVFDVVSAANGAIDDGDRERAASMLATVAELAGVLGIEVGGRAAEPDAEIDALVAARDAARAAKDYAEADRIRAELASRGVTLEDTAGGTTWHRS